MITEEIAKKAKVIYRDTYVGAIQFQYEEICFSVLTRKGVKEARLMAAQNKKIVIHKTHEKNYCL